MILKIHFRKSLSVIASCVVSVGLLALLIGRTDLSQAVRLLTEARSFWLGLAVCLAGFIPLCGVFRFLGIVRVQQNSKLPLVVVWRAVMFSYTFNAFLPVKGGDFAKAFYFRHYGGLSLGMGVVVLERLADLFLLGLLGMMSGLWSSNMWGIISGAILSGGSILAFTTILYWRETKFPVPIRWRVTAAQWSKLFLDWITNPASVCLTVGGSLANWCIAGLIVCALGSSITDTISWGYLLSIFPLAILAGLIPITIAGIGTRDSAFVILLSGHIGTETATIVALGYTILVYWFVGLLCLSVVFRDLLPFMRKMATYKR